MYLTSDFSSEPIKNIVVYKSHFRIFTLNNMKWSLPNHSDWQKQQFLKVQQPQDLAFWEHILYKKQAVSRWETLQQTGWGNT